MGLFDLSATLAYLWDRGYKKARETLGTTEKGVLKSDPRNGGAFLGSFAMPHDPPEEIGSRGYGMVYGAVDVGLFRNAALEDVRKFKISLTVGSDDDGEEDKDGDE